MGTVKAWKQALKAWFVCPKQPDWNQPERGDVPGWVLITLMTAALVVAIWAVASDRLIAILNSALDKIAGI